jgi:hypothetical protein
MLWYFTETQTTGRKIKPESNFLISMRSRSLLLPIRKWSSSISSRESSIFCPALKKVPAILFYSPMVHFTARFCRKFTVQKVPYLNTEYIGFQLDPKNLKNQPVSDKRVRQALNYALNKKEMIRYYRNGLGIPGHSGMVPPSLPSTTTAL